MGQRVPMQLIPADSEHAPRTLRLDVDYGSQAPGVDEAEVRRLLAAEYGILDARLRHLTGYDDLNFLAEDVKLDVSRRDSPLWLWLNEMYGERDWSSGGDDVKTVVKFTNPMESRYAPGLLEAQLKISRALCAAGVRCPLPLPNLRGTYWTILGLASELQPTASVVTPLRLFSFCDGEMWETYFRTHPDADDSGVLAEIGRTMAVFQNAADALSATEPDWDRPFRDYFPMISARGLHYLEREFRVQRDACTTRGDEDVERWRYRFAVCERILAEFGRVLAEADTLSQGVIHGDINDSNVLLTHDGGAPSKPRVGALLDMGDVHRSLHICDVANTVYYMAAERIDRRLRPTTSTDDRATASTAPAEADAFASFDFRRGMIVDALRECGALILAGYVAVRKFPTPFSADAFWCREAPLILTCVKARLVQSLIYARRTSRIRARADSDWYYITKVEETGWKMLELIHDLTDEDVTFERPSS